MLMLEITVTSFMIFIGVIWFYATWHRWWIIDPPETWWWFDSNALVKKLFGSSVNIANSYIAAVGFVVVGTIGLIIKLTALCHKLGYCG